MNQVYVTAVVKSYTHTYNIAHAVHGRGKTGWWEMAVGMSH